MKLFFVLLSLFTSMYSVEFQKLNKIVLSGPMANVTHPLLRIIDTGALNDIAQKIEFHLWKNPDELRALSLKHSIDFVAVPTNVAATLYNKGVDIKLLNVSVWSILSLLTRDENLKKIEDFKGKTIAIPFRSDMPDIVFQEIAKAKGLDVKKDFTLQYLSSPLEAMQMLILRRIDHALLAEPATSIALRKTGSFPLKLIAPDLYRSSVLAKEWGEVFKVQSKIPVAGIATIGKIKENDYVIKRFNEELEKATFWYKNNPKQAGELAVKYIKMLEANGVADSIEHIQMDIVQASQAKKDLEFFMNLLYKNHPKSIGEKLPDDQFYFSNN